MSKDQLIREQLSQIHFLLIENQSKLQQTEHLKTIILSLEESLSLYNNRLEELDRNLQLQDEKHCQEKTLLQDKNQRLEDQNKRLFLNMGELQEQLLILQKEFQSIHNKNNEQEEQLEDKEQFLLSLRKEKELDLLSIKKEKEEKEFVLSTITKENENSVKIIKTLEENNKMLIKEKEELEVKILEEENKNRNLIKEELRRGLIEKDEVINDLKGKLDENNKIIEKYEQLFYEYNMEILSKEKEGEDSYRNSMSMYDKELEKLKEIMIEKDGELNKFAHELHLKKKELNHIKEDLNGIGLLLEKEDYKGMKKFQAVDEKINNIGKILGEYIVKKLKYEKFFNNFKKKKEFSSDFRRISEKEQRNKNRNTNEKRVKTEPLEKQIKGLEEQLNYLEDLFKNKKT